MPAPQNPLPAAADWTLLGRLFDDETSAFRHHLGLARSSVQTFYAPTAERAAIRAEKQAILASPEGNQYLLQGSEGEAAFDEFAQLVYPQMGNMDRTTGQGERARALTLALEPDWLLLDAPEWRLVGAGVCFPTRWSLVGKRLQSLPQIHAVVPDLQSQIGKKIDVFFGRMTPGEGWGRANWGLSTSAARNQHPSLPFTPISDETPIAEIFVRVESQNLCKLPATGAMAFGIRILSFPLAEVMTHPAVTAGLKQQLRTMPSEVARYKGIPANFWERL